MNDSNDYPYLRAWCEFMESHDHYLQYELKLARRIDAPQDLIYFNADHKTFTRFDGVNDTQIKACIGKLAEGFKQ